MKWILFAIAFLAVACSTQQADPGNNLKKAWEGRQTSELFEKWGYPPDELNREGDKMIYTYRRSNRSSTSIRGSLSGYDAQCNIAFETRNDLILGVQIDGDESCIDSNQILPSN